MSDIERAFLAAVRAAPDDDLPRLIFADWLEEHGQPERAEFIRVQCELVSIPAGGGGGHSFADCPAPFRCDICIRYDELRTRERELLERHYIDWAPPWRGGRSVATRPRRAKVMYYSSVRHAEVEFRRGFVSVVECDWPDWLRHHEALLATCPIRCVDRGTVAPDWRGDGLVRLTSRPPLRSYSDAHGRVTEFWLDGCQKRCAVPHWRPGDYIDYGPLIVTGKLLADEWPGVRFELPDFWAIRPPVVQSPIRPAGESTFNVTIESDDPPTEPSASVIRKDQH